jgi:hypothetical protein
VTYATSASAYNRGRYYADKSLSMQSFPRRIKTIDGVVLYHDIDMVNAHPVLLSQICELFFSFVTNHPQNYLKNHPKNTPKNTPKNPPKTPQKPPKNPPKTHFHIQKPQQNVPRNLPKYFFRFSDAQFFFSAPQPSKNKLRNEKRDPTTSHLATHWKNHHSHIRFYFRHSRSRLLPKVGTRTLCPPS